MLQNPIFLKEAGKTSIKLNLSWITLIKTKPWITPALQKSISIKNAIFKRYIKLKSPVKKNEVHQQYKYHRNLLSTLMKKSKQNERISKIYGKA